MNANGVNLSAGADSRIYNAHRDIAHNFGHFWNATQQRLLMGFWPSQEAYRKANNISKEQIIDGLLSLSTFVTTITTFVKEDMDEVLERAGWHNIPFPVQQLIMSEFGAVVLGASFSAVRSAHAGSGVDPTSDVQELVAQGSLLADLFRMSATRRFIRRFFIRLKRAAKIMFGKQEQPAVPQEQIQEIYTFLLSPLRAAPTAAPPVTEPSTTP